MTTEITGAAAETVNALTQARRYVPTMPMWGKWYSPDADATGTSTTTTTDASATTAGASTTEASGGTQTSANGNGKTPIKELPQDVQVYIEELRDEAKKYRLEKAAAERTAKEAEEARLAQQNEWKVLAEKRAQRIAELEPVELQHREIQEAFNAGLEAKLKDIPEDVRKSRVDPVRAVMTPVAFSKWLDTILPDLKARQAPDLDAGAGGAASGKRKLDPKDIKKVAY